MFYLKKYKWLDLKTRAVFIEFLTYNPNCNLFNTVQVVFEIGASGYVNYRFEIQTRRLLIVESDFRGTQVVFVCFGLVLLLLTIRVIYKMIKKGKTFFSDALELFDVIIVLLSIASIYLFINRIAQLNIYLTKLSESKNNEFVNYFHLFVADNTFTALSASLVFLATFRLWKLLRFMKIVKVMEKTLYHSSGPLLAALLYHSTFMVALSVIATSFFGSESEYFRNFYKSMTTLLLLSMNLIDDFPMHPFEQHKLGSAFFVLFALLSIYFINVYIVIITYYYSQAKTFYCNEKRMVQEYLKNKWIYYTTLLKVRLTQLRGGQDIPENLIQSISVDRYNDLCIVAKNRMKAMALISKCVLRNEEKSRTMTEEDYELISEVIWQLFRKDTDEKELFFKCEEEETVKFVDDRKIEKDPLVYARILLEMGRI
ncbi:polycystic kidney disease 2-like 1 protein [Sitophilus oryzae]|uniref:Polycystic kidney disease 2-like 1 protein n=1 Tax=Sitophilus oryzae TaxID=7048 RepID=A0A6J2XU30_SITOR|nr:polycystic kidney disease 2-like 1 protein [Sitophilus oryzae]